MDTKLEIDVAAVQPRLMCSQARMLSLNEETRQVRHVISTSTMDRSNRIVEVTGWKLANFRDNPIVFADHDYELEKVIGKAIDAKIEGDLLVSTTEFGTEGLANVAFRLVQAGLVRAWSVGWRGLKAHYIGEMEDCETCNAAKKRVKYGAHFVSQELLEYSLVTIPANPDAVMGLQTAGLVKKAEAEEWVEAFKASEQEAERGGKEWAETFLMGAYADRRGLRKLARKIAAAEAEPETEPGPDPTETIVPARSTAFLVAAQNLARDTGRTANVMRATARVKGLLTASEVSTE